jgi:tRNA(Arg) A34 adenosine deaminase TadA
LLSGLAVTSLAWNSNPSVAQPTSSSCARPNHQNAEEIKQPALPSPEAFIQYAFEMRRLAMESGDQPFGAIIVKENRVVGLGPSRVVIHTDPTAHAETEAIRDACCRLGTRDLSGCVIYSTSKPCRMCETACYWANLSRMYYSLNIVDAGAPTYSC